MMRQSLRMAYFSITCSCIVIIVLLKCVTTVVGAGECKNALQAVATVNYFNIATNGDVYQTPKKVSTKGVCKLPMSCCSSNAEQLLRRNVLQNFQKTVNDHMKESFCFCNTTKTSIQNSSINYIISWRSNTIDILNAHFKPFENPGLLDTFTSYMTEGIRSLNLLNFKEHVADLLFSVYYYSFKLTLTNNAVSNISTVTFRSCLKEKFLITHESAALHLVSVLESKMNLLFRFLSALETSDRVLERITSHVLNSECGDTLLRLTHCETCSGTKSINSQPPCALFCQNVLRGCLVDLTEVGEALREYATALEAMQKRLAYSDNPYKAIDEKIDQALLTVSQFGREAANNWTTISKVCAFNTSSQADHQIKQVVTNSVPFERLHSTQMPLIAIDHAVSCVKNVSKFVRNLPDQLCQSISNISHYNCWNGTSIGSYSKPIQLSDRSSQLKNPEFVILSVESVYSSAIAQLHSISMELTRCANQKYGECNIESPTVVTPMQGSNILPSPTSRLSTGTSSISFPTEESPKQTDSVQSNDTPAAANIIVSIPIASVFLMGIALLLCCHIYHKLCRQKKKTKGIYDRIHITRTFNHNQPPSNIPPELPPPRISICANPVYNHFDPAKIALNDCAAYETIIAISNWRRQNEHHGIYCLQSNPHLCTCSHTSSLHSQAEETMV